MRLKTLVLLSLSAWSICLQADAQKAMYLYSQGACYALDTRHVEIIKTQEEHINIDNALIYPFTALDSISFGEPQTETERIGWWGDATDGSLSCYYQSFRKDCPDIIIDTADSLCTSALYYLPEDAENQFQGRQKVGRKWRYVKNTLSGRRKFELHHYDATGYGPVLSTDEDGRDNMDLSTLFSPHPVTKMKQAVNYWYHPEATDTMPSAPLFGTFDGKLYQVMLPTSRDTLQITVFLDTQKNGKEKLVMSDTLKIKFPDSPTAKQEFELMDTHSDEYTSFYLHGKEIIIIEQLMEPLDKVKCWLTRFDLDVCRPVYIREEE